MDVGVAHFLQIVGGQGRTKAAATIENNLIPSRRAVLLDVALDDPLAKMDRARQVEALQAMIERIGYDGAARQISIRFHPAAITPAAGEEARV